MDRPIQNEFIKISRMMAIVVLCSVVVFSYAYGGSTSSQTAYAKASVKTSLGIYKNNDLDFGDVFPGDPQMTVLPENTRAAVFTVTGEPTRAYNITLPSAVTLTTGNGSGGDKQIIVNRFTSSPARTGRLDATGHETLRVGATLGNIKNSQESGAYTGTFIVAVIYQ